MQSAILQSLLDSPGLPELVEESHKAPAREQKLR